MKYIGTINEAEKNSIYLVNEKMKAINELILSINDFCADNEEKNELFIRIGNDRKIISKEFSSCLQELIIKYKWNIGEDEKININFSNNEVYII